VVSIYLKGGAMGDQAKAALVWLNDPRAAKPLLGEVRRDPATLKLHHMLLSGMLAGADADEVLRRQLGSSDADQRFYAATALGECKAEGLADGVPALLGDTDLRVVRAGVHIAFHLSGESFGAVRPKLLDLLGSADLDVKLDTACGFAAARDPICGRTLIEFLRMPSVPPNTDWRVMQAISKLADSTFNYDIHHWGPENPRNQQAIQQFHLWLVRSGNAGPLPPPQP
jgi:hypothetical protein